MGLQSANGRDIASLQNWVDGTGCLARDETAYLTCKDELVSLAPAMDSAVLQLETWVEDKLIRYWHGFRRVRRSRYNFSFRFPGFNMLTISFLLPTHRVGFTTSPSTQTYTYTAAS